MSNAGKRHIEAVQSYDDLSYTAFPGDMSWVIDEGRFYVWTHNDQWETLGDHVQPTPQPQMSYDFLKQQDVVASENFTTLNSLTTPPRPTGVYEVGYSLLYDFDETNRAVFLRWSTDGGNNWTEISEGLHDVTENIAKFYQYPIQHGGGPLNIILEIRKEDVNGTLNVNYSDVWFRRVL